MRNKHLPGADLGLGQKTLSTYCIGTFLSIILTLIPFYFVYYRVLSYSSSMFIILSCAVLQFFVQAIYLLRLTFRTRQGKLNTSSLFFSIFILFIIVGGSMWIMNHLNYNMTH